MSGILVAGGRNTVTPSVGGADSGVSPFRFPLPLDRAQSAVLAFSISRRLRTKYAGAAIRVRRSTDNAEKNIGFTSVDTLDTTSLESFAGAGDAYITKVYEQSGHAAAVDMEQATAAQQLQIVSSGSVITKDGNPAMLSADGTVQIGTASWATRPSSAMILDVMSVAAARANWVSIRSASSATPYSCAATSGGTSEVISNASGTPAYYKNAAFVGQQGDGATRGDIHAAFSTDALLISRHQGIDLSTTGWDGFGTHNTGASFDPVEYHSEIIIITDTAEVAALEANIADFFGIAVAA